MLSPDTLLQNRYRIIRRLGSGGMGAVYEAVDERLSRTVALKQMLVDAAHLRQAFEREARLLANLRHPHLPIVHDHFLEAGGQFLVMEFIHGEDLKRQLEARGHPFTTAEVLDWADQILSALVYLHHHEPPVIHRDIKPSNLKVSPTGQIFLLDFGLAKGVAGDMTRASAASSVAGYTLNYAPLEQIQGEKTDPQTDLYSLAATLYHLLTGRMPPDALRRALASLNEEDDPLIPLGSLVPELPVSAERVLMDALSLKRSMRPRSAEEMRERLRGAADSKVGSREQQGSRPRREKDSRGKPSNQSYEFHSQETIASPPPRVELPPELGNDPAGGETQFQSWAGEGESKHRAPLLLTAAFAIVVIIVLGVWLLNRSGQAGYRPASTAASNSAASATQKPPGLTATTIGVITTSPTRVYETALSPDGQYVAATGNDRSVRLWRVNDRQLLVELKGAASEGRCLAISADGGLILSGRDDGTLLLWRKDGTLLKSFNSHKDYVFMTAWKQGDEQAFVSVGADKVINFWRQTSELPTQTLAFPDPRYLFVTINPAFSTIAFYGPDKGVRLWSVTDGRFVTTLQNHRYEVTCGAFDNKGIYLALGSSDGHIRIWRVDNGQLSRDLKATAGAVGSLSFSPDGRLLLAGYNNGTVRLWGLDDSTIQKTLEGHRKIVQSLSPSADGRILASGSDDATIRLWRLGE